MDRVTYDLIAFFRDLTAFLLLLSNFPLLILTLAGRELSNKGLVKVGCYFTLCLVTLLNNGRGIFPNRWPALVVFLITVVFWALLRLIKRAGALR